MPLGVELLKPPAWRRIAPHVVVVSVQPGEDRRPGGTTQRVTHEGVLEGYALLDQRRADFGHPLSSGEVKIVGKDEDYVGLSARFCCLFFCGSSRATNAEEGHQACQKPKERAPHPK